MTEPDTPTSNGEQQLTDRQFEALLHEYDKLKDESTERIKARDNFVYLNVASIGLLVSFAGSSPEKAVAYLAIPWISIGFGWTYLMNDEKISALARYTRYSLRPRIGGAVFGWEVTPKRRTTLSRWHRWGQFVVDLLMFVVPTPVGIAAYARIAEPLHRWTSVITGIAMMESVLSFGLFSLMLAHSPVTRKLDVKQVQWATTPIDQD